MFCFPSEKSDFLRAIKIASYDFYFIIESYYLNSLFTEIFSQALAET
jgi:hypothetical protein